MPPTSQWPAIGNQLVDQLPKRMFLHQKYGGENPLKILTPNETVYFGVKSYNIFIAQKPYGWKQLVTDGGPSNTWRFNWPPEGWDISITNLRATYANYFASYKTLVYIDMWLANQIKSECPDSDIIFMMNRTASHLQQLCVENADLFEWKGSITTAVEAMQFRTLLENFYGHPSYLG